MKVNNPICNPNIVIKYIKDYQKFYTTPFIKLLSKYDFGFGGYEIENFIKELPNTVLSEFYNELKQIK